MKRGLVTANPISEEADMSEEDDQKDTNPGTGPAHIPGTPKGENLAKGESDEELKEARRSGVAESKPTDEAMPDQA
jgi:hypothetical protein